MHEKLEIIAALVRLGPSWIIPYLKQVYYKSELDSRRVAARGMVRTTVRVIYRNAERSLTQDEVNTTHEELRRRLSQKLAVSLV